MASTCGVFVAVAVILHLYPDYVTSQQSRDIELGIQGVYRGLTSGRIRSPGYPGLLVEALQAVCIITPETGQLTVTLTEDHIDTFDVDRTCRERIDIVSSVKPPMFLCEDAPEFQESYVLFTTQSVSISVTKCYSVQGGQFQIDFSVSGGGTVKVECRQKTPVRDFDKCPPTTMSTTSTTTTTARPPPTTTEQPSSESPPETQSESDPKLVIIIVGVIGGVTLLAIIIALVVCLLRTRRRNKPQPTPTSTAPVSRNNGMTTLDGRYENVEVSNGVRRPPAPPPHVNTATQVTPTDTRAVQTYAIVEMEPVGEPSTSRGQVYTNVRTKRNRAKQSGQAYENM